MIIQLKENFYNLMNLILLGDDPNHDFKDVLERWENQLGAIQKLISNVIYFTTTPQEGGKINHNLSKKSNNKGGQFKQNMFGKKNTKNNRFFIDQTNLSRKKKLVPSIKQNSVNRTVKLKNRHDTIIAIRKDKRQDFFNNKRHKDFNNNNIEIITFMPEQKRTDYNTNEMLKDQSIIEDKTESLIQSISCALLFQSFSMKFIFEIYKQRGVADITDIIDANHNISLWSAIYYTIYNLHQGNVEVEVCNKVEGSMEEDCNMIQDNKNNPNPVLNELILFKFLNFCKNQPITASNIQSTIFDELIKDDIFVSNADFNNLLSAFLETNAIGQCINEYAPTPNRGGGYKQKGGANSDLTDDQLNELISKINEFNTVVESYNTDTDIETNTAIGVLNIKSRITAIIVEATQLNDKNQEHMNLVTGTGLKYENAQNELKESSIELVNANKLNQNPTLLNYMSEIFRKNSNNKKVSQTDLNLYNLIRTGLLTQLKDILRYFEQKTAAGSVDNASGNPSSGSSIFPVLGKGSRKIKDFETYFLNGYYIFMSSLIEGYKTTVSQNAAILDKIKIKQDNEEARLAAGGLGKIEKETKDVILNWVTNIALKIAGVSDEPVPLNRANAVFTSYPTNIVLTEDNANNIAYMHNKVVNMLLRLVNRPSYSTNNDIDTQLYEAIKKLVKKRFPNNIIDSNKSEIICQATINTSRENLRTSINNAAHLSSNYKDKTEICPYSAQGDGQPNCTENTSIGRTEKGNTDVEIGFDENNRFRFTLTGNQDGTFTYTLQIITNRLTGSTIMITPDKTSEFVNMSGNGTKLVAHKTLGITLNSLEELISELEEHDWNAILDEHVEDENLINKTFEHIYTNKKQAFLNSISNIWFKMLGDCMQEFNAVFKNGGYIGNPTYEPLIAKWIDKSAIRGFFANDRPSAVRFILWLLFGEAGRSQEESYINQNSYGGYFSKEDQFIVGNIDKQDIIKPQICIPTLLLQGGRKTKKNRNKNRK
jgi:hypothetical protein